MPPCRKVAFYLLHAATKASCSYPGHCCAIVVFTDLLKRYKALLRYKDIVSDKIYISGEL